MSFQPERPARPLRAKPATDEDLDPVDYRSAPTSATTDWGDQSVAGQPLSSSTVPAESVGVMPAAPATRFQSTPRGREATVQLATRISPEIDAILTAAASRTGQPKRTLVEEAIKHTWA